MHSHQYLTQLPYKSPRLCAVYFLVCPRNTFLIHLRTNRAACPGFCGCCCHHQLLTRWGPKTHIPQREVSVVLDQLRWLHPQGCLCPSGGRMIASQGTFPRTPTPPGNSQGSRKGNSGIWLFSGFIDLGDTEESTREGFVSAQEMGLLK